MKFNKEVQIMTGILILVLLLVIIVIISKDSSQLEQQTVKRSPILQDNAQSNSYKLTDNVSNSTKIVNSTESNKKLHPSKVSQNIALHKPVYGTCPSVPVAGWPIVSNFSRLTNGVWTTEMRYPPPLDDPRFEYIEVRDCGVPRCVTVDLLGNYYLNSIIIYNGKTLTDDGFIVENVIQTSSNNATWQTVFNYSKDGNHLLKNGPQNISFESTSNVRYIKQCLKGNNYAEYQGTWMQIEAWSKN